MATTIPTPHATDETLRPKRDGKVVRIERPSFDLARPVILASPHSGREYDADLRASTRLSVDHLRRSEDAYVDQLVDFSPEYGASLICAEFPRVFVDVNRAVGEIDPGMFSDRVPADDVQPSRRAASGLGVIPRIGADGRTLYRRRLRFAEAQARLARFYHPYHQALQNEIAALRSRFGCVVLADMHSMPALSAHGADIVLGDRFGTSCSDVVIDRVEALFRDLGFVTVRNNPYAGGYVTEHYGRPMEAVNVIQIEINRRLYMDENRVTLTACHAELINKMRCFVRGLTATDWSMLR
ncbi:N-formylglutamate amidohydrolase [Maricaulis sp. W15]|uniref:N-formylglutamate amidohydrolase n=1 Tax=Maricaulis sp. W15 TaxID=1772333 RepID=UPI0009F9552A|nr:N-formylglutamate amidohydrolase [Maricaulis sp. W15]